MIDIGGIEELATIEEVDGAVATGALVKLCDLAACPLPRGLELLSSAAAHVGSEPIRTLATLGGNLCYGLPTSELALAAMAAGAEVSAIDSGGQPRVLGGDDLARLRPGSDESPYLVTGVRWPIPPVDVELGVDVIELGEQGNWLPVLAITTLVHAKGDGITVARAAIGVRDGRKSVLVLDDPLGAWDLESRIGEQITSRVNGESVFPVEWVAAHAADSIRRAAARTGGAV